MANDERVGFVDAMTIEYECPKCGHSQKQTFRFKHLDANWIQFQCKKCNYENAVRLVDNSVESDDE